MNYLVYEKATGFILRAGVCPADHFDLQPQAAGEAVIEGRADDSKHMVVEGKIVERPEHLRVKTPTLTYEQRRSAEYPAIAEQLDAIWKGGAALEEMRASIAAVKAKYPKE